MRLVTATNRVLPAEIERGSFRADLFYRLRVVELVIPPLRERPDELEHLVRMLIPAICARLGRPVREYSPEAWAALRAYRWPGNIRELEHAPERACVVAEGRVREVEDLPDSLLDAELMTPVSSIAERERRHAGTVLAQLGGDRRRAAAALGVSASTLRRRLRLSTIPRVPNAG